MSFDDEFEEVVAEWGDGLRQDYEQYVNTLDASVACDANEIRLQTV